MLNKHDIQKDIPNFKYDIVQYELGYNISETYV